MIYHILLAFVVTFIITVVLGKIGIPMLRSLHAQQSIREEGPESHQAKAGTPTMGGAFMMIALVLGVAIFAPWNVGTGMLLFLTLGHSLLGFFDDFVKAVKKRNLGLTAKQKLLGQFILAAVFCYCITEIMVVPTTLWIPVADVQLQLGWGYYVLAFLIIVGATNAVNLTDGLDGLASSITTIVGIFFMLVSYIVFKEYGVTVFSAALIGGLIGFLWYNKYPAKVFMGDTGSLFLGASVALMAIDLKMPIHLILIGFVYFMETLSVIMQTAYFKYTKKKYGEGRRIFKMSPIHHHFEMCGWKEKKIVAVFTLVTVITCAVAYFAI